MRTGKKKAKTPNEMLSIFDNKRKNAMQTRRNNTSNISNIEETLLSDTSTEKARHARKQVVTFELKA
jgi:hypothetical protein